MTQIDSCRWSANFDGDNKKCESQGECGSNDCDDDENCGEENKNCKKYFRVEKAIAWDPDPSWEDPSACPPTGRWHAMKEELYGRLFTYPGQGVMEPDFKLDGANYVTVCNMKREKYNGVYTTHTLDDSVYQSIYYKVIFIVIFFYYLFYIFLFLNEFFVTTVFCYLIKE